MNEKATVNQADPIRTLGDPNASVWYDIATPDGIVRVCGEDTSSIELLIAADPELSDAEA